MNRKSKQRIIVINLLLFALLFGLVSLNKEFLRPLYSNTPVIKVLIGSIKVLIGSFPNFIAAYIISLAFMNAVVIREPKYGRLIVYLSSFLVFAILTIEEFKPIWGASTHYDPFDIFASGLGSLLTILTFELVVLKRKTK